MAPSRPERTGVRRLLAAWGNLEREHRVVVVTALVLLASMLLPWYSLDAFTDGRQQTDTKMAITVFSFVEAAIFLVAVAVVALVLARGDRRAFHLPGGDGTIVTIAGGWVTFLVFYRFVDKPNAPSVGSTAVVYNLSWGIFFGLLAPLALTVAGLRLRAAQIVEPVLPASATPATPRAAAPAPVGAEEETRAQRRQEREQRRRASADTPVRERRPTPSEPSDAPTSVAAPTRRRPCMPLPTKRPRGTSSPAATPTASSRPSSSSRPRAAPARVAQPS